MSTLSHVSEPRSVGFLQQHHFLLRRLHSFTGVLFGMYILVHLTINATLVQGRGATLEDGVFQKQVDAIHSLPFLKLIEWAFIFTPIIYHTLYGFYIVYTGQPNVGRYGYTRNWLYFFQRVTAIVILFFMLFHVLGMKGVFGGEVGRLLTFDPHYAYDSTARHLQAWWWVGWVVYPIGILASAFHLANGFYAGAITWGVTITRNAQNRWGLVCIAIFGASFLAGMVALIAGMRATVPAAG
jgi:succinate dehydrogenase / fumarate reductase cytochrome b subunit